MHWAKKHGMSWGKRAVMLGSISITIHIYIQIFIWMFGYKYVTKEKWDV